MAALVHELSEGQQLPERFQASVDRILAQQKLPYNPYPHILRDLSLTAYSNVRLWNIARDVINSAIGVPCHLFDVHLLLYVLYTCTVLVCRICLHFAGRPVSSRALEWIVSDPAERVWTGNPELLRLVNVDRLETALRWLANDLAFENRPFLDVHDTEGHIMSARSPYSVRAPPIILIPVTAWSVSNFKVRHFHVKMVEQIRSISERA